ncbi:GntR family transcriptional regulator [Streptomyces sp. NPDC127079]|uniref:GntR family transcriptional regulator n=1 Tax=Streptomyces sp. NPDC127079 TaxID=3347132 RepID=UPI003651B9D7
MAVRHALTTDAESSETVYRMLRNRIMTCELRPGQWLTERRIAVEFGLGLPPARQALTRLIRDGLVQQMPPHAYRITPLTLQSADDLFTAWAMLGPEMAALGTSQADPKQAAELRRLIVDGNAVIAGPLDRDSIARFIDITEQGFDLLAVASRNDRLIEVYRSLAGEMWRVLTLILHAAGSVDTLLDAGVSWDSTFDRRDGLMATRIFRHVATATRASAMDVLGDCPKIGDNVVVPLGRRAPATPHGPAGPA